MAINLNQLNVPALAAFAGKGAPRLPVQRYVPKMDSSPITAALGRMSTERMQGARLGQQQQQFEAKQALEEKQMGIDQQRQSQIDQDMQRQRDIQNEILIRKEKRDVEKHQMNKAEMDKAIEAESTKMAETEEKETIEKKAAAVSIYLQSPELMQDPEKANEYITGLVQQDIFTEDEASKFIGADQQSKQIMAKTMLAVAGKAIPKADKQSSVSSITRTLPDGTVEKEEYQKASSSVKTGIQKDIRDARSDLTEIKELQKDYQEGALTWKGQAGKGLSQLEDKAQGIPGVEQILGAGAEAISGKSKEERKAMLGAYTRFENRLNQFFNKYRKQITGVAAGEKEMAQLQRSIANETMSPAEYRAAVSLLFDKVTQSIEAYEQQATKGIKVKSVDPAKMSREEKINWLKQNGGQ